VVNALDRSSDPQKRREFASRYRRWFPERGTADESWYAEYYRTVRLWWRPESGDLPQEEPDPEFGFEVAILRHKLMVIWSFVNSGAISDAEKFIERANVWLDRYHRRRPSDDPDEEWRCKLMTAINYLERILQLLKICENPECQIRYFIREKQKKYCSTDCALRAQELRRRQWVEQGLPGRELTPEGRQRISQAATERWVKYREAKKQSSKEQHKKN